MQSDKLLHLLACFGVANSVADFTDATIGFLVAASAAVGKELYDQLSKKGTPEKADLIWGVAGAIFGAFLEALSRIV